MKKLLIVLSLGLTGCLNEPQSIEHTGKDDKADEKLFTEPTEEDSETIVW